ncbi:MAG: MFS transporter [Clostridiales Family XIII bacterium]|jgi:sugar (glycoside-pentoside-hexuronide) transporter|nr:MFS transporter [Clostridiales Family XIII bacterium]
MEERIKNKIGNASLGEANVDLTLTQKLPYLAGTFGGFTFPLVMAFLTIFWTDVARIPAGAVAAFLLVTKLWDAVNDPIIGYMADRTQTRFGRYRPWILMFLPTTVLTVLTFTVIPGASPTQQAVFSLGTYFVLVIANTCVEVPSQGVIASATTNPRARGSIQSFRMAGSYAANILTGAVFMPMVLFIAMDGQMPDAPPDMAKGFFYSILFFAVLGVPFGFWFFLGSRERVKIPVSSHTLRDSFSVLKGNKPFWLFFWAFFVYGITSGTTTSRAHYWQYLRGDAGGMAVNITAWMIGMVIGAVAFGFFVKKAQNKAHLATIGYIVGFVFTLLLTFFWLTPESSDFKVNLYHFVTALNGIGVGFGTPAMYAIMPDVTEYTQWKYKLRVTGFVVSILNCAYKFSLAFGAAAFTAVLAIQQYVPNVPQPDSIKWTMNIFANVIPAICYLIPGLMMLKWKLDVKGFRAIVDELAARSDA